MKAISLLILLSACAHDPEIVDPIRGPLKQRNESFRACYHESEVYRGRFSAPHGEMEVSFLVTKEGKVKDAKVIRNTFPKDPGFIACVLDQVRKLPYEELKEDTVINHVFDFKVIE